MGGRSRTDAAPCLDDFEEPCRHDGRPDSHNDHIYRAFIEDQLDAPKHLARTIHAEYFNPAFPEFAPRTEWSLQNAFTSTFKLLDPVPQFKATASLGEFFRQN